MAAAVFFDLDRTLWACSGEQAFARHRFCNGQLNAAQLSRVLYQYLRYELGLIGDMESVKRRVLHALLEGEAVEPVIQAYSAYFRAHLSRLLFPAMLERVRDHRLRGDDIVIVSAALSDIVSPVADLLNANAVFATQMEVIDQRYTGKVLGAIHYGEAKASAILSYADRYGVDLACSHAYGDHWEDRHMLGLVGHPVAVNPDRRLARLAQSRRWPAMRLPKPRPADRSPP